MITMTTNIDAMKYEFTMLDYSFTLGFDLAMCYDIVDKYDALRNQMRAVVPNYYECRVTPDNVEAFFTLMLSVRGQGNGRITCDNDTLMCRHILTWHETSFYVSYSLRVGNREVGILFNRLLSLMLVNSHGNSWCEDNQTASLLFVDLRLAVDRAESRPTRHSVRGLMTGSVLA